jgi:hypothetical protein
MNLRRLGFASVLLCLANIAAHAQAAAEYALKSAGSAVAGNGGSAIAGCRVDSTLLPCLSRSYPRATTMTAVVISVLFWRWLTARGRYGTR